MSKKATGVGGGGLHDRLDCGVARGRRQGHLGRGGWGVPSTPRGRQVFAREPAANRSGLYSG
jgi:hypothetical protein